MKVDFDNLRCRIGNSFNSLLYYLDTEVNPELSINVSSDIKEKMYTLRNYIATLLCCEDDNAGIKSIDYFNLYVFDEDEEEDDDE